MIRVLIPLHEPSGNGKEMLKEDEHMQGRVWWTGVSVWICLDANDATCGFPGGTPNTGLVTRWGSLILLAGWLSKSVQVHPFLSDLY